MQAALERGDRVIDVREDDEWASGHVAGAEHVPMRTVPARLDELRGEGTLYVVCEVGDARQWSRTSSRGRASARSTSRAA